MADDKKAIDARAARRPGAFTRSKGGPIENINSLGNTGMRERQEADNQRRKAGPRDRDAKRKGLATTKGNLNVNLRKRLYLDIDSGNEAGVRRPKGK